MLTNIQAWKRLNEMGVTKTLAEVETALATVNQEAMFNTERSRYTIAVWDKVSPINGVSAEQVLQGRNDICGEVYLVYVDGNLLFFQPHNPAHAGFVGMDAQQVLVVANSHADQLAWGNADAKIFDAFLEKVLV